MNSGYSARWGKGQSLFIMLGYAATILAVSFLGTPQVLALDRMGSPVAQYGQGQLNVGLDYASGETDLWASGRMVSTHLVTMGDQTPYTIRQYRRQKVALNGVDMDRFYTTLGYGVTEQLDVFFRLGGSRLGWSDDEGTSLALGGGVRATLYSRDRLRIGCLAQIGWSETEFDAITFPINHSGIPATMHGDLSLYEIQLTLAASYEVTERISIYGGPFYYFADGDLDLRHDGAWGLPNELVQVVSLENSYDLDETSRYGAYLGAQYKIMDGMTWDIEFQYTDDAHTVATGLMYRLR
jgi:hypothetical protein